jgi:hypothetical protein
MNPKTSFGNPFCSKRWGLHLLFCGIVQLTNFNGVLIHCILKI